MLFKMTAELLLCVLFVTLFGATTIPDYNRDDYGKSWATVNSKTHINTRDSVLIRDNTAPVGEYIMGSNYKINMGFWTCPYCGQVFNNPSKMDIDHMVPLSEAHISGAYSWTPTKKKQYFNYLGNKINLRAVCYDCNRTKSDSDPTKWMPKIDRIPYLKNWVSIKKSWGLKMDTKESTFINKMLKDSVKIKSADSATLKYIETHPVKTFGE